MARLNPKPLIEVRCRNSVTAKWDNGEYRCNALLAKIEEGRGCIRCRRCKHLNHFDVIQAGQP